MPSDLEPLLAAITPMTEPQFHRKHHFVPRLYLKRFAHADGRLWVYRTLVSHQSVPLWKSHSIRGVAYHSHLYTRIVAGGETDQFERWLDREFEDPAEEAINKAVSGSRLSPDDWQRLIRFAVAQYVRTPAHYLESAERWVAILPQVMEESITGSLEKLDLAKRSGAPLPGGETGDSDGLPLSVTITPKPGQDHSELKAELTAGRALWLWEATRVLTSTIEKLRGLRWTILTAPDGLPWFTTDDPLIRLNFYAEDRYDFKGGWGNPGTDIMLPLSPHHLLYTQVGKRPPRRGKAVPRIQAEAIRRCIAEHAHRMVFATAQDTEVPDLRPRIVDAELCRQEGDVWRRWHEEQSAAERQLRERGDGRAHHDSIQ